MKAFFQEIAKAVRDFKFYKDVKDFQISKSMKYIFLLIFLITLVLTVRYSYDVRRGLDIAVDWAKINLPVIEIQNGVASVDVKQPYRVEEEGFTLIIDTTGEVTSLDGYDKGILLMKNKLVYKEGDVKTETYDLSNVAALRIDENFMNVLSKNITWILFPFMLIGMFLYFCVARFLQIFIFSIISLAASSITNVKLRYKQLFNIGVYAITPSAILGGLLALFGIQLPLFGLLFAGLYIAYLIMAIMACKETPSTADIKSDTKGDVSP